MSRTIRLLALSFIFVLALTSTLTASVRATVLAPTPFSVEQRPGTPSSTQPGPIVQQAYGLLMDRFVTPPNSGTVLDGGLNGAREFLASKGIGGETVAQAPDRWDTRQNRPSGFTGNRREDWQIFLQRYSVLARTLGDKAPREVLDRAIVDGMAKSLKEGHTYYMSPEEFKRQQDDLQNRNQYGGVGISMSPELYILDVFEGSPAAAAGVMPGDKLIAVNGESVEGLTTSETSTKVRGEVGTPVTLTFQRANEPNPVERTIVRAIISIQWIQAKILDGKIGYLKIQTFANPEALPLFNEAMQKFIDADIRALVIDVRNNGGGAVATGQEIASRLIPEGKPLFRQVDRRNGERTVNAWGDYWHREIPMAILTNENSASMSEILASALQENGIARVFGVKTAGAVAAGVPYPLSDGSGLLVTVQTITSGKGKQLNEIGLEPDEPIALNTELFRQGKDNQLDTALAYVREKLKS